MKETNSDLNRLSAIQKRILELTAKRGYDQNVSDELVNLRNELRGMVQSKKDTEQKDNLRGSRETVPTWESAPVKERPVKKKSRKKKKPKRRLNRYQKHMSECLKGTGKYDGDGRRDFNECIYVWHNIRDEVLADKHK